MQEFGTAPFRELGEGFPAYVLTNEARFRHLIADNATLARAFVKCGLPPLS